MTAVVVTTSAAVIEAAFLGLAALLVGAAVYFVPVASTVAAFAAGYSVLVG